MRHSNFGVWCVLSFFSLLQFSTAGTVDLPSYPLAVKSPYLSTWLPTDQTSNVATAQPQFWAGQDLTWVVLARINNKVYSLFGLPEGASSVTAATTAGISYTSSHTIINVTAGSADFSLDFFSPVLPGTSDYVRQSLPYSYLTVSVNTAAKTSVQIMSGIDQTWTAQNGAATLNYTTSGSAGFFWFFNPNNVHYTEVDDMATYGSVVYGITTGPGTSHACNTPANIYSQFVKSGALTASSTCPGTALAALSSNLGTVSGTHSVTFTVGHDRVYAINYLGNAQTGLFHSKYNTVQAAVAYALSSYSSALSTSNSFDSTVRSKAQSVSSSFGSQYADIVEASVRQTFAAFELTVPLNNLSATPQAFLKEISSDGNVNTVDLIFQSWPIFISLNPVYIKYMFQPILNYLASGKWPKPWVIHDIGTNYPNATGHNLGNAEEMPLFECSTLFILLYAYQKYTGDKAFAQQYSSLLPGYANYLAANTLYPASQLVSVDAIAAQPNQTALAIQATIGLKAASIITGNTTLSTLASSYADTIYNKGLGLDGSTPATSTHFTYYYGQDATWNVLFAAYSDVLLGLNTFPAAAWQLQSSWYQTQMQVYGLPFAGPVTDTNYDGQPITWGLSDWNIVAASVSSTAVQQAVINTTHAFLTNGVNNIPFGTKYYVEGPNAGQWIANKDRSTVGSDFALLALKQGTFGTSF